MRPIVSILLFAAGSFVFVIAATRLFSAVFGSVPGQMLGPSLTWIGLVVTWIIYTLNQTNDNHHEDNADKSTGEAEEEEGSGASADRQEAGYQSRAQSFSGTDELREPLNRTGLRRSNDKILEEAGTKPRNQIEIYDDGTIELDGDDLDLYRHLMLYVVAKRMAYEDRFINAPEVTVTEINDRRDLLYNKIELLLFLREAHQWLIPPTDQDLPIRSIDYADLDDAAFTVKTRSLSKIADWILEEPLPKMTPSDISSQLSNAAMMLDEARNLYDRVQEDEVANNHYNADHRYDPVRKKVLRACTDARRYPVMFERDNAWTQYTEYAEALLDFFEKGSYTKTEHCVPRMERYRRQMKKKADDASYF